MHSRPRRTPEEQAAARHARDSRAEQMEDRLAVPVIIAAAVSIPAVFLSVLTEGTPARVGTALNWVSLTVLTAESVLLFLLTGHRLAWIWRHKWTLAVLAIAIPAMIFIAAPAQALRVLFRIVHFVGALRILRAGRIIKAGRVLARRIGWDGRWRYLPILAGSVVAAVFVGVVLSDPTSVTRDFLEDTVSWLGIPLVVLAGAILAVATFIVVRYRRRDGGDGGDGSGGGRAGDADDRGEVVSGGLSDVRGRSLHHHPDQ